MAREFSKKFYKSKEWQMVRDAVLIRDHFLCVKCGEPAEEVHHIVHLSQSNIYNTSVTLNMDNLASLCKDCHFKEHYKDKANGHMKEESVLPDIVFDENGVPIHSPR